jgi:hypothetical protein
LYVASQRTRRRELPFLLLDMLPPIAVLLLYQKLHFGGWFVTAAVRSNPVLEGADFQRLSIEALWSLLFSFRRGAIVFMPILSVALVNALRGPRLQANRNFFVLCALNVAFYLVAIASFRGWYGGNATGPRYLIVSLPFWCLLLPAVSSLRPPARASVFNLGQLLHLPNRMSTVPLLVVLFACVLALFRSTATIPSPSPAAERA